MTSSPDRSAGVTRDDVVRTAAGHLDSGRLLTDLTRRVAHRTESAFPAAAGAVRAYLTEEMLPALEGSGFAARVVENPVSPGHPFLLAHRVEGADLPTVLLYGHGDVQPAHAEQWREGLDPWVLTVEDDDAGGRWFGRGVADNKGQHSVDLAALDHVVRARGGVLGYNVTLLLDMGEEVGSPGLAELCAERADELAADLLLGSDGPRVSAGRPTVFLGSRGTVTFTLRSAPRSAAQHSGNWGGVLTNPAVQVAAAVAALVDGRGRILLDALRPCGPRSAALPEAVREALADVPVDQGPDSPAVDPTWGEPGLTPAERLYGWNTLEVLAMTAGTPEAPVGAVPAAARAHLQLRCVVGTDVDGVANAVRAHLAAHGLDGVEVGDVHVSAPTRLDPRHPWVGFTLASLERTTGVRPALLPNLGGTLPNAPFAHGLGLPTVWVPHSYPGCGQHAADEHLPVPLLRESLQVMAGLWWDLAELDLAGWGDERPR